MTMTAGEQYMMELINRARLDPLGEAARYGIDLNQGLAANQLGPAARGVLAAEAHLEQAAIGHSQWMLANDVFSHTGVDGSTPTDRVVAAGYEGWGAGENISWRGTTGTLDLESAIAQQHVDLFLSPGHRVNILYGSYREIGIAQEEGLFQSGAHNFNASMVTQNFSTQSGVYYVTGVVYNDSDADRFYSIGEGVAGASFATAGYAATSQAAGGYALQTAQGAAIAVTGQVGGQAFEARVEVSGINAKLDILNGSTFQSSVDITLVTGIHNVRLLGTAQIDARGNGFANVLEGTAAVNRLYGLNGDDRLLANGGNDRLYGGNGLDVLDGGAGRDYLRGGSGADTLSGGSGIDVLYGDTGNDLLTGGSDSRDTFIFQRKFGLDVISDFGASDRLRFDDAIWAAGQAPATAAAFVDAFASVIDGDIVIDIAAGHVVTLDNYTNLAGLAGQITLY